MKIQIELTEKDLRRLVFGVVEYDRRLSDRDVETYELSIVGEGLGTVGG